MSTPSPLSIQRSPLGVYTVTDTVTKKTEKTKDLYVFLTGYLTLHADLTADQLRALKAEVSKLSRKGLTSRLLSSGNLQPTLQFLDRKITSASTQALPSTSASAPPRPLTHAERRREAVDAANMAFINEDTHSSSSLKSQKDTERSVSFQTDSAASSRPSTPPINRRNFKEIQNSPSPVSVEEFRSALKKEAKMIAKLDMLFDDEVGAWLSDLMQQSFDEACQKFQNGEISRKKVRLETYKILKAKIESEKQIQQTGNPELFVFLLGKAAKSFGFPENASNQRPLVDHKAKETRELANAILSGTWKEEEERPFTLVHLPETHEKKVLERLSYFFHGDKAKTAFDHLTL